MSTVTLNYPMSREQLDTLVEEQYELRCAKIASIPPSMFLCDGVSLREAMGTPRAWERYEHEVAYHLRRLINEHPCERLKTDLEYWIDEEIADKSDPDHDPSLSMLPGLLRVYNLLTIGEWQMAFLTLRDYATTPRWPLPSDLDVRGLPWSDVCFSE